MPRLAVVEGFRLHADTAVLAHDRQGLERLCRYGSRGPIAEERLSVREDVWSCRCGGIRTVLALITHRRTAEEVLANMGLLEPRPPPRAHGPPQLALPM